MNSEAIRIIWNEIDLDILASNMRKIREMAKSPDLAAVIKADAYGHGAVAVANTFLANGATHLAVARLTEGMELREHGITAPIFLLGYTEAAATELLIANDIATCVFTEKQAIDFAEAAKKLGKKVKVHIGINTGMNRIGFAVNEENLESLVAISQLENIEIQGIFTHFCLADRLDKEFTRQQYTKFKGFCDALEARGVSLGIRHCSNSAAILELPEFHLDMVRAGIILYGLTPSDNLAMQEYGLAPAMSFKCKITCVKEVAPGEGIGYGHTYIAPSKRIIGTIPVGYADGYSRNLSNRGYVLVRGQRAPIVGNICMDQCMIDITDIPRVEVNDEVVLFGKQGNEEISVEEIAEELGTINYEIPCMIARRVPKFYYKQGKLVFYHYYLADR